MCHQRKCFGFIPVEHGCLVFAVISAVLTGITLLASIVLGILAALGIVFATRAVEKNYYPWSDLRPAAATATVSVIACVVAAVVGIASLIAFIFSVLLCNGICQRRPGQVKAYFVYGVVITTLAVVAAVGELVADGPEEIGVCVLLGCVVYALFLVLVHHTYLKMREGAVFKDHVRLVESYGAE